MFCIKQAARNISRHVQLQWTLIFYNSRISDMCARVRFFCYLSCPLGAFRPGGGPPSAAQGGGGAPSFSAGRVAEQHLQQRAPKWFHLWLGWCTASSEKEFFLLLSTSTQLEKEIVFENCFHQLAPNLENNFPVPNNFQESTSSILKNNCFLFQESNCPILKTSSPLSEAMALASPGLASPKQFLEQFRGWATGARAWGNRLGGAGGTARAGRHHQLFKKLSKNPSRQA